MVTGREKRESERETGLTSNVGYANLTQITFVKAVEKGKGNSLRGWDFTTAQIKGH